MCSDTFPSAALTLIVAVTSAAIPELKSPVYEIVLRS